MILYFANRKMDIIGHASTHLSKGLSVENDAKIEDVETGVTTFECDIPYTKKTRSKVDECTKTGNYILRRNGKEHEFYTIIDRERDTKKKKVYIYAEDAGLDLINEVVGSYEADKAYPITHYINKFAYDSGFVIGRNDVPKLTRKLSWDGEATATERIASVATQFDGCEISYSFDVKGLVITNKYINIHKQRGKDVGVQLRLDNEIDCITTKESIANLATALQCTGGTPEIEEGATEDVPPITLNGYSYDDGDFYVDNGILKSRKALKEWSRYLWANEPNQTTSEGHIVRQYSYDTTSQKELCAHAITELKKNREIEVNYEVEITKFPESVQIGDRINIIDDAGEVYISARVLMLETSVCDKTHYATLGEYLIKKSGIHEKVLELASRFAKATISVKRAREIAELAKKAAATAQTQADNALLGANNAQTSADEAQKAADAAALSASNAQQAANAAQTAVNNVEKHVDELETSVENAQKAAEQAEQAATKAQTKAEESHQAALNAEKEAVIAQEASATAQAKAEEATTSATNAQTKADQAIEEAQAAATEAAAAKLDAEQAQKDIDNLGNELTTLSNTMSVDYARKTDLTESEARLQTQITQNAAEITSTASKVQIIDETANNAAEKAEQAQTTASQAQTAANEAAADALAAQEAAALAEQAAQNAQAEADTAREAADTAKSVADKAEEDLEAAKADLATVSGRVDATEEEIEAAQAAVDTAQVAADKAKADAEEAVQKAQAAQATANTAVSNAASAQETANDAVNKANIAQQAADQAKGDAAAAQATADQAKTDAANAQAAANAAKTDADNAQAKADEAAQKAQAAQTAASEADAKAAQANTDLETARQNLANVEAQVGATQEEVEAAKADVIKAQQAADQANTEAEAAQAKADQAKADAATAQTAANTAKTAADNAQKAADEAQAAADAAQEAVDALAVRVTTAETKITQNSEQILLMATKTEVTETLGGYYTKEETEATIDLKSDEIKLSVNSEIDTKIDNIEVGGRNYILNSGFNKDASHWTALTNTIEYLEDSGYNGGGLGLTITATGTVCPRQATNFSFKKGQTLTGTVKVKDTENTWGTSSQVRWANLFSLPYKNHKALGNDWYLYVYQATLTNDLNTDSSYPFGFNYFGAGSYIIDEIKLEIGTTDTDWTLAPEDVESDVETAESIAIAAQTQANNNTERVTVAESTIQQLSDAISFLVTDENGTSLMTQTSGGWTFNIGAIQKSLESAHTDIKTVNGSITSANSAIDSLNKLVSDISDKTAYIIMATDDSGNPCIELGKADNDFKVRITNTSLDFLEGTSKIAWINNKSLYITKAVIKEELQIGETSGFVWRIRENGNMGLMWIE